MFYENYCYIWGFRINLKYADDESEESTDYYTKYLYAYEFISSKLSHAILMVYSSR